MGEGLAPMNCHRFCGALLLTVMSVFPIGVCGDDARKVSSRDAKSDALVSVDGGSQEDAKFAEDASHPEDGSTDAGTGDAGLLQPLTVDPRNPHYFLGMDGKPLLFLTHASNTILSDGYTESIRQWYIDELAAHHLNIIKLVAFPSKDVVAPGFWSAYLRVSGQGTTHFGNAVWDLDQFDGEFFRQVESVAAYARDRGVYVQVQIWNHIALKAGAHPWRWDGDPFNPDNCIQDTAAYGFPGSGADGSAVFYGSLNNPAVVDGKTLLDRQEEFFDRIVLATRDYPNVFYELGLEVTTSDSAWALHWLDRLHSLAPGKLMIVDTSHYSGDASLFDGYTVHEVSVSDDSVPAALYSLGKPGIEDTDFDCNWAGTDISQTRRAAWRAVLSGVGFNDFRCQNDLLDGLGSSSAQWVHPEVVETLGRIADLFLTQDIPLDLLVPSDDMATSGVEVLSGGGYLVAYSMGSDFTLTLPTGTYHGFWFDPITSATSPTQDRAGGVEHFAPPSSQEWVLVLHP